MSESEGYILIVSRGKEGVRVYILSCTKERLKAFWNWYKGREAHK